MKVLLYGRFGEFPRELEETVRKAGLITVDREPEVVLSYGGDGTLLGAERDFPGIPKLPLKASKICHVCSLVPNEQLLEMLAQDKLKTKEYLKLESQWKGKKSTALNEFAIRNALLNSALRFKITIDGVSFLPEQDYFENRENTEDFIGDGLVISSPFGSTGYYHSTTRNSFSEGIGLALNNVYNSNLKEKNLPEHAEIKVEITRGPGVMSTDNDPDIQDPATGDVISIRRSPQVAKILLP